MGDVDLEALALEIRALTPPARLRLAADLMERRRGDVAHAVAREVVEQLGAALARHKLGRLSPIGDTPAESSSDDGRER